MDAFIKEAPTTVSVVCLSGGVDSSTLLADALCTVSSVVRGLTIGVFVVYPSKHNKQEEQAAQKIADHYGIPLHKIDLTALFNNTNNALIGDTPIPEGHYTDESMKATVVPLRNIVFLSAIASMLMDKYNKAKRISFYIGVHAGDHPIYPDCRPKTMQAFRTALQEGSSYIVHLLFPYLYKSKGDIVMRGIELNVPYELTRTCYTQNTIACGKCGSCIERLEAFNENGVTDPIPYDVTIQYATKE